MGSYSAHSILHLHLHISDKSAGLVTIIWLKHEVSASPIGMRRDLPYYKIADTTSSPLLSSIESAIGVNPGSLMLLDSLSA